MPWRTAGIVMLDQEGRYRDANVVALELLGVDSVEQLRATSPGAFQPLPPDAEHEEAFREAFLDPPFRGLIGEGAVRRLDGELVRVRIAIIPEPSGGYRALLYPVERPTSNLEARVYKIADVLAEWRTAERRLVDLDPETAEGRRVAADVELLREQYQLLFNRKAGTLG